MRSFPPKMVSLHSPCKVYENLNNVLFSSMKTTTLAWLEPEAYESIKKTCGDKVPERVYFNKGL